MASRTARIFSPQEKEIAANDGQAADPSTLCVTCQVCLRSLEHGAVAVRSSCMPPAGPRPAKPIMGIPIGGVTVTRATPALRSVAMMSPPLLDGSFSPARTSAPSNRTSCSEPATRAAQQSTETPFTPCENTMPSSSARPATAVPAVTSTSSAVLVRARRSWLPRRQSGERPRVRQAGAGRESSPVAAGHSMLGVTLAPAVAVAELLTTGTTQDVLRPFDRPASTSVLHQSACLRYLIGDRSS